MSEKEKQVEPVKNKKPNLFVRLGRGMKKLWRDYISELKKVVWMPRKELKRSTLLVCVAVICVGAAIGIVDFVFSEVIGGVAGLIG